jgi:hypothetical protein
MLRTALAFIAVCLAVPAGIYAKEDCYSCHGRKGKPGYVDRTAFVQSVHGLIACSGCHTGLTYYPHGSVESQLRHLHFREEGAPAEQAHIINLCMTAIMAQQCRVKVSDVPRSYIIFADPRSGTSPTCRLCLRAMRMNGHQPGIYGRELQSKNTSAATCFDCHLGTGLAYRKTPEPRLMKMRNCHGTDGLMPQNVSRKVPDWLYRHANARLPGCAICTSDPDSTPQNIVKTCRLSRATTFQILPESDRPYRSFLYTMTLRSFGSSPCCRPLGMVLEERTTQRRR